MLKINQRAGGLRFASPGRMERQRGDAAPAFPLRHQAGNGTKKKEGNVVALPPTAVADVSWLRRHVKLYLNEAYDAH